MTSKPHPSPGLGLRWDSTTHKNSQISRKRLRNRPAWCRFCQVSYERRGPEGAGLTYTKETGELHKSQLKETLQWEFESGKEEYTFYK